MPRDTNAEAIKPELDRAELTAERLSLPGKLGELHLASGELRFVESQSSRPAAFQGYGRVDVSFNSREEFLETLTSTGARDVFEAAEQQCFDNDITMPWVVFSVPFSVEESPQAKAELIDGVTKAAKQADQSLTVLSKDGSYIQAFPNGQTHVFMCRDFGGGVCAAETGKGVAIWQGELSQPQRLDVSMKSLENLPFTVAVCDAVNLTPEQLPQLEKLIRRSASYKDSGSVNLASGFSTAGELYESSKHVARTARETATMLERTVTISCQTENPLPPTSTPSSTTEIRREETILRGTITPTEDPPFYSWKATCRTYADDELRRIRTMEEQDVL